MNSILATIGLQSFQPWYRFKSIFRLSKYYKQYQKSQYAVSEFINLVYKN